MNSPIRRILLVEDEPVINAAITDRLVAEGYDDIRAWDGPGAVAEFTACVPDLVLLDVMLPGFDGHEVCRRIQAVRPVPVLMLTARNDEALVGLAVGADDYLTKPFRMREFVARIAALLRRVDRSERTGVSGSSARMRAPCPSVSGSQARAFVEANARVTRGRQGARSPPRWLPALSPNRGCPRTGPASRAGMTQPALSRLEAGGAVPTIPVLERIAIALGAELIVAISPHAA